MDLYGVIGNSVPTALLEDPRGAEKIAVALAPENGVLEPGCLLYQDTSTGLYAPAAAAQITTTNNLVVLADKVDTGTEDAGIAEDAAAYRSGRFVDGKVFLKAGGTLTAAQKQVMRLMGLLLKVDADTEATVPVE